MRKIILFIAASIDGKIARTNGDIDWLDNIPNPENTDYGYAHFYEKIDTTFMGHNTYKKVSEITTVFPYKGKKNYVFTHDKHQKDTEFVNFISGDIVSFAEKLRSGEGKDIWLIGGGQIITLFLNNRLIDELHLFVMPVIIGSGLPLFGGIPLETSLLLQEAINHSSGVVKLVYKITT